MKTRAAVAWQAGQPLTIETVDLEGPRAGEVLRSKGDRHRLLGSSTSHVPAQGLQSEVVESFLSYDPPLSVASHAPSFMPRGRARPTANY